MGEALPVLPDVTRQRELKREPRAAVGQRPVALPRHFDIDIRHAAVDCDAARPRAPLG